MLEFPVHELAVGNGSSERYALFGGFSIPGEVVEGGVVYFMKWSHQNTTTGGEYKFTALDMYRAIAAYAMETRSYKESMDGYALALCLYASTGLANMSLPRPQGISDLFTPVNESQIEPQHPPQTLNPAAVMGAVAVTRQAMLLEKDMTAHFASSQSSPGVANYFSSREARAGLYCLFRDRMFT